MDPSPPTMEVTVRFREGERTVSVQVLWHGAEMNLNRDAQEPVERFLQRLGLNCCKQTDRQEKKRAKKERRKADGSTEVASAPSLSVSVVDRSGTCVAAGTPIAEALCGAGHVEIDGERLPVVVNPPSVQKLEVYGQPLTGCPLVASLRCEFCEPEAVRLRWLSHAVAGGDPGGQSLGEGAVLWVPDSLAGEPITLCADKGGRPMKIARLDTVEAPPQGWPQKRLSAFGSSGRGHLRVVCFNTLAAVYSRGQLATKEMYPYCPPQALDFSYRQPLIGRELARLGGDVVCLQECSFTTFRKFLVPIFGSDHHLRISLKASKASEGCVLMLRKEAFEVLEEREFLFRNLLRSSEALRPLLREVVSKWPNFLQGVLPHMSTIFQISAVKHTGTGAVLVVANTHLFFHPRARHMRLLQAFCLLSQVQEMRERHLRDGVLPRVVFCGDLNCSPDTAVLRLLLEGHVPSDNSDWDHADTFAWQHDDDDEDNAGSAPSMEAGDEVEPLPQDQWQPGRGVALQSPVGVLTDVYASSPLPFTNYVAGFNGTLDWIMTAGGFEVVQTLAGPSEEDLLPHGGLPSVLYPSDHVAIAADLRIS